MSQVVELIKERLSIADVVGQYVELKRAGKYLKGKSPFTNERTPSFYVTPDKGLYHCFSTGKGGDVFTFVQEMEGVDFKGALKILAERAGVELVPEDPAKRDRRDRLIEIVETATAFFEAQLARTPDALAYLERRGVKPETIKQWRIGFAPEGWSGLRDHLAKVLRATDSEMLAVGLVIEGQRGAYDRFRSRVMFPICDASGRVVGFSGRAFGAEAEERGPKYMNSPEGELFDKSSILHGFHLAKQSIHRAGYAVLVEGQMDLVMSHQAGVTNAIASSGTALTEGQLALVKRIAPRLMVAYDSDVAGTNAAERACKLASSMGFDVKVVRIVGGKDPADLVREDVALWKAALASATPIVDFKLATIIAAESDEAKRMRRVDQEVVPYLVEIAGTIERSFAIRRVATEIGQSEEVVARAVAERARAGSAEPTRSIAGAVTAKATPIATTDVVGVERTLAIAAWLDDSTNADVAAQIKMTGTELEQKLSDIVGTERVAAVKASLADLGPALAFRAADLYSNMRPSELSREIHDLLGVLELSILDRRKQEIDRVLGSPPADANSHAQALQELQTIIKRKQTLQATLRNPTQQ
jgi:DNA primase